MPAGLGEILPGGHGPAAAGVFPPAQIDVVADVVLVQAHGAVARKREVLAEDQICAELFLGTVSESDLPAPSGPVLGEDEAQLDLHALPIARSLKALRRTVPPQRRLRPEQRNRFDLRAAVQPQPHVRGRGLHAVAHEEVHREAAESNVSHAAVAVELQAKAGGIGEAEDVSHVGHARGSTAPWWVLWEAPTRGLSREARCRRDVRAATDQPAATRSALRPGAARARRQAGEGGRLPKA